MTPAEPDAYCFFQQIEPRPPLVARFDRDYLLHAVEGALRVAVNDVAWTLPPSFAAWVPAGTAMTVTLDRPVTSCSILVRPGMDHGMPNRPVAFQMTRLTREMASHCRDWGQDGPHPPGAAVFFAALLSTCAGLVQGAIDVTRPLSDDPGLSRALHLTEERLDQPLTAAEVAAAAGLSERTLQRRAMSDLGASWGQVLKHLRMIRAVELLALRQMSVTEVALSCGYSSMSAFNRAFKAYAGQTPTAFQDRLQ